jgi:U3 small nucleolar RNA-associated protein 11
MQRLLMGRGGRIKLRGVEKVEGEESESEDEEQKANHKTGRRRADEATYKPRVYKWRLERKR